MNSGAASIIVSKPRVRYFSRKEASVSGARVGASVTAVLLPLLDLLPQPAMTVNITAVNTIVSTFNNVNNNDLRGIKKS